MSKNEAFYFSLPEQQKGKPLNRQEYERQLLGRLRETEEQLETVLWELVRLFSVTRRQVAAQAFVKRILAQASQSEEKAACLMALGQLMEQIKDFKSAINYYRQALSLNPTNAPVAYFVRNNLGFCLNHLGEYGEAETHCRAAVSIDPERHNAYKNLGIALSGQAELAEAAGCFVAATKADASDTRALKHLESLVVEHPEILTEVTDIRKQLEECRKAARVASGRRLPNRPRYTG